jgi:multidrug resistance efflux pump
MAGRAGRLAREGGRGDRAPREPRRRRLARFGLAERQRARANLEQGDAEMREAESNYRRSQDLYAKKFISEATLDTARAALRQGAGVDLEPQGRHRRGRGQRAPGRRAVEQTLIRAPFDGIVLTKNANVGDIITPSPRRPTSKGAVVNMADMDTLEVEADVSEASIGKISVGMPTEIQLDAYPDVRLLGEVSRIVPDRRPQPRPRCW